MRDVNLISVPSERFLEQRQVVQTQGTPLWKIVRAGANVTFSWPAVATGFLLQQNSNVAQTTGWNGVGQTVTTTNGTNFVSIRLRLDIISLG